MIVTLYIYIICMLQSYKMNNEIQNKFTFDLSNAVTDLSIGNGNGNVEYTGQGFA